MKKRLIIYIPTIVVLGLFISLLILNHQQTPAWKTKLDQYLSFLRTTGEPSYQLIAAVQASQPSNFSPNMTTSSFSGSAILPTPDSFDGQFLSNLDPVSFPPDQVWCVLLKDNQQQQLVFVALHNNQNNANWIVHIPPEPWGSPALQSSLSAIGCPINSLQ